jgi:DNA-dependent RNA polymerase auxiliary subunit epsilon
MRQEVRILIESRGLHLEAVAEVFGEHSPDEAVRLVRDALKDERLRVEYVDPAVEG